MPTPSRKKLTVLQKEQCVAGEDPLTLDAMYQVSPQQMCCTWAPSATLSPLVSSYELKASEKHMSSRHLATHADTKLSGVQASSWGSRCEL